MPIGFFVAVLVLQPLAQAGGQLSPAIASSAMAARFAATAGSARFVPLTALSHVGSNPLGPSAPVPVVLTANTPSVLLAKTFLKDGIQVIALPVPISAAEVDGILKTLIEARSSGRMELNFPRYQKSLKDLYGITDTLSAAEQRRLERRLGKPFAQLRKYASALIERARAISGNPDHVPILAELNWTDNGHLIFADHEDNSAETVALALAGRGTVLKPRRNRKRERIEVPTQVPVMFSGNQGPKPILHTSPPKSGRPRLFLGVFLVKPDDSRFDRR